MGQRGPAKTPTAILAQRGSWRSKVREGEPEADGTPIAPAWLSDGATEAWDIIVPRLVGIGVAGEVDSVAIARYCVLLDQFLTCVRFVAEHGLTYEAVSDSGATVKEHPQVGRMSRLADQLLRLEGQYGMTASARASLAIDTSKRKESEGLGGIINQNLKLA